MQDVRHPPKMNIDVCLRPNSNVSPMTGKAESDLRFEYNKEGQAHSIL